MFKKYNTQSGFMHLQLIIAVAAVLVGVGLVGSYVVNRSNAASVPNCSISAYGGFNDPESGYYQKATVYISLGNLSNTSKVVINWDDNMNGTTGDTQNTISRSNGLGSKMTKTHLYQYRNTTKPANHRIVLKAYCTNGTTTSKVVYWKTNY